MYEINIDCVFMFVLTPGERLRCSHVTDNIRPKHSPACCIRLSERFINLVHMYQKQTKSLNTYLDQKSKYKIKINVRTWGWKSVALKCIGCVPKPQNQSLTERDAIGGGKVRKYAIKNIRKSCSRNDSYISVHTNLPLLPCLLWLV